jgi:hypothetical protein
VQVVVLIVSRDWTELVVCVIFADILGPKDNSVCGFTLVLDSNQGKGHDRFLPNHRRYRSELKIQTTEMIFTGLIIQRWMGWKLGLSV